MVFDGSVIEVIATALARHTFLFIGVDDFEVIAGAILGAEDTEERTNRLGGSTAFADDAPDIFRIDAEAQKHTAFVDFAFDNDLFGDCLRGFLRCILQIVGQWLT